METTKGKACSGERATAADQQPKAAVAMGLPAMMDAESAIARKCLQVPVTSMHGEMQKSNKGESCQGQDGSDKTTLTSVGVGTSVAAAGSNLRSAWSEGVAAVRNGDVGASASLSFKLADQVRPSSSRSPAMGADGSASLNVKQQRPPLSSRSPGALSIPGPNDIVVAAGDSNSAMDHTMAYGPPVVAELAMGPPSELLREKEEENRALRKELQRIADCTFEALEVAPFDGDSPFDDVSASSRSTVKLETSLAKRGMKRLVPLILALTAILVVTVLVIVLSLLLTHNNNADNPDATTTAASSFSTSPTDPVLETIRKNGVIRCRAETYEVNQGHGFTVDLCRALAAAVFQDPSKVVFLKVPFREQFRAIANGTVDISTTLNTLNMARDVYQQESRHGFAYSDPYFYSGVTMGGLPTFVDCVDRGDEFSGDCRKLVVCVIAATVTKDIVNKHVPGSSTLLVANGPELIQSFVNGTCNVMAGDILEIYEDRIRQVDNYTGEYTFSSRGLWSFDPLAMITRQSDPQWAAFCNWVLRALITAEYLDITQATADSFANTTLFGEEYQDMFVQAIRAVGNYGELYAKHYEGRVPRQGMNVVQRGGPNKTGLLVTDPLGKILIDESLHQGALPEPVKGGTLESIRQRGFLRCGLVGERAGFAEYNETSQVWSGMDVEFCKAISASILTGEVDTIVYQSFYNLPSMQFAALSNEAVDVLAGGTMQMNANVKEPTTGQGYSFSPPYFYEAWGAVRTLVTTQDDPQWSDLVRWVSQATVYAEREGITQQNASLMPVVELFGTELRQMFRDAIMATGNYEELYQRTLAEHVPREGWNLLNPGNGAQLFPYLLGEEESWYGK
ncbi:Putative amino-acid ABC transporter-binding protein YhdW [Seminavis robusta]|uniref:Amino-acid ABC transporter-binding protein YhdW n=1 Tax=Seminavis robusta TaxID=568900 RepID=A0A9N8DRZ6_9STRA|nr:Putative amino-acid ABC transporter-binding protein YhdW [Seminavis robusta]|eukprot:Sro238_g095560.1 Putative amino-acid ABC transporter-binding protein YhdW (850) ;mRNA; r:37741-40388